MELNHVRDCVFRVISICDFLSEDKTIRVLGVIDDISILVVDGNVGILFQEINNLRVGFWQFLCLGKLQKQKQIKKIKTTDGKESVDHDKTDHFQTNKNGFNLYYKIIFSN